MKVSFILPAFKRRFLKEAIASILAQTYRDFELVVVDDCSPENLKEVVDEFQDERLSYHRNAENLGGKDLVAAWEHAMTFATGEWCILASDDDVYHPEYLQEMVRLSEKYPKVDLFHCRISIIDGAGKTIRIGDPRAEYESWIQMVYHAAIRRIDQRMADLMFRREAYRKSGGFYWSPTAWYSDLATAIRLARPNGAVCSPRVLFGFRESGENITTRHDDAAAKVEAGVQFREWVVKLIGEMSSACPEDELYIQEIGRCNDETVMKTILWVLHPLSFFDYCRVVRKSRLSSHQKRILVCKRILQAFSTERMAWSLWGAVKRSLGRVRKVFGV